MQECTTSLRVEKCRLLCQNKRIEKIQDYDEHNFYTMIRIKIRIERFDE